MPFMAASSTARGVDGTSWSPPSALPGAAGGPAAGAAAPSRAIT